MFFSVVFDLKDFLLETFAVAAFTLKIDVGHELHLNLDLSFSLACLTATALNIEGKV